MDAAPTLMTAEEVSEWLRIAKSTLYKLCKEGKIPSVKVGKHWRFDRKNVESWLVRVSPNSSG
jgi:excisionase family DNA binding protein